MSRFVMMPTQHAVAVDDRQAGDAVLRAHAVDLGERGARGVVVTGLVTMPDSLRFTRSTVVGLLGDREVAVQDAHAALARAMAMAMRDSVTVSIAAATAAASRP